MKQNQKGFSLIELLIVVTVILVVAAIAIPNYMRSRLRANEASAISSLHDLNTACVNYASTYNGYPAQLAHLGPGAVATATSADLVDSLLASGVKSGYVFTYTPGRPINGVIHSYTITANPTTWGSTGERGFFTDQSFVIRFDSSGAATASSAPIS